jgi:hypothetical protein
VVLAVSSLGEAHALYRSLTDERPWWTRLLWPLPVRSTAVACLHCALWNDP